jgi:urease accessory protein
MRATAVRTKGSWPGPAADRVTLDHDGRHRRRIAMTGEGGLTFLLDLAQATSLRDGDGLLLEDGRVVEVRAAAEELLEIRGRDRLHLLRLAWHLGNRHLAAQIEQERILILRDHVIAAMLAGLGATLREVVEPFDPETGAYHAGPVGHAHSHGHAHG